MNRTDLQLILLVSVLGFGGNVRADQPQTIGPLGLSDNDRPTIDLPRSDVDTLGAFDPMMIETELRERSPNVRAETGERRKISDRKLVDRKISNDVPSTKSVPTLTDLPPARSDGEVEYRFRVGDEIGLTFLPTTLKSDGDYRLAVGDQLVVESSSNPEINRGTLEKGLVIQPDGTITLRLIGQVHAAGQTVEQLRDLLKRSYREQYPEPDVDVTPVNTGDIARKVRESISNSNGLSGRRLTQRVTTGGRIRLPQIGTVQAEGLTRDELKQEINLRYDAAVGGLAVDATLHAKAPDQYLVLGKVARPGYQVLNAPTTVRDAIVAAGGQDSDANLAQVVIFRRTETGEFQSTMIDMRGATSGRKGQQQKSIAVRDGDLIVMPDEEITRFNRFARKVLIEEAYGDVPLNLSRDLEEQVH